MLHPLTVETTASQNFGYDHQLQDSGLVPESSLATQIFIADSYVEIRDSFYGRRSQVLHTMQLIIMNFQMMTDGKE